MSLEGLRHILGNNYHSREWQKLEDQLSLRQLVLNFGLDCSFLGARTIQPFLDLDMDYLSLGPELYLTVKK